ncbi:MAG: tRNA-dihydrouridine synthase, partial [Vicinamibacterales bacterium]
GSGDCVEPEQILGRLAAGTEGVLVGRGVLRNPWILAQTARAAAGLPVTPVSLQERGQFLLDYIDLLLQEGMDEASGFRHSAVAPSGRVVHGNREKWVVNKIRALCSWYTKGMEGGSELRTSVNQAIALSNLVSTLEAHFRLPDSVAQERTSRSSLS